MVHINTLYNPLRIRKTSLVGRFSTIYELWTVIGQKNSGGYKTRMGIKFASDSHSAC